MSEQRAELRELRDYFGLAPHAGINELNTSYREKVKEVHPDTGAKDTEAFLQVKERYTRAKQLLGVING